MYYCISNSHECMGVIWEASQLHTAYKNRIFTASHSLMFERAMVHDYHHSTKQCQKNITFCCHWHCYLYCALVPIHMYSNILVICFGILLCTVVIIIVE